MTYLKAEKVRRTEDYPKEYKEYLDKEIKWVKNKITFTEKLLDAGCGDGRLYPELREVCKEYVGIDLDRKAIDKAKKFESKDAKFFVMDITKLSENFPSNYFDTIVCLWNTLGNIEYDKKAIVEFFKIVKNNCIISTVEKGNFKLRLAHYRKLNIKNLKIDRKAEIIRTKEWGVARAYSKKKLKKLCEEAGFKVLEIKQLGKIGIGIFLKKPSSLS